MTKKSRCNGCVETIESNEVSGDRESFFRTRKSQTEMHVRWRSMKTVILLLIVSLFTAVAIAGDDVCDLGAYIKKELEAFPKFDRSKAESEVCAELKIKTPPTAPKNKGDVEKEATDKAKQMADDKFPETIKKKFQQEASEIIKPLQIGEKITVMRKVSRDEIPYTGEFKGISEGIATVDILKIPKASLPKEILDRLDQDKIRKKQMDYVATAYTVPRNKYVDDAKKSILVQFEKEKVLYEKFQKVVTDKEKELNIKTNKEALCKALSKYLPEQDKIIGAEQDSANKLSRYNDLAAGGTEMINGLKLDLGDNSLEQIRNILDSCDAYAKIKLKTEKLLVEKKEQEAKTLADKKVREQKRLADNTKTNEVVEKNTGSEKENQSKSFENIISGGGNTKENSIKTAETAKKAGEKTAINAPNSGQNKLVKDADKGPDAETANIYGWDEHLAKVGEAEAAGSFLAKLISQLYYDSSWLNRQAIKAALQTFESAYKETDQYNLTEFGDMVDLRVADMGPSPRIGKEKDQAADAMSIVDKDTQRNYIVVLYKIVRSVTTIVYYASNNPDVKAAGDRAYVLRLLQAFHKGLCGGDLYNDLRRWSR